MERLKQDELEQVRQEIKKMPTHEMLEYKHKLLLEIEDRQTLHAILDDECEVRAMEHENF